MQEQAMGRVGELSREVLEELALRAVLQLQAERRAAAPNSRLPAVLAGFFIATLVAVAGVLIGSGLR